MTVVRDDLIAYLGGGNWTPNTAKNIRVTFRTFFGMLYELEHRRDNPGPHAARRQDPPSYPTAVS